MPGSAMGVFRRTRIIDVFSLLLFECWSASQSAVLFSPQADFASRYGDATRVRTVSWNVAAVNNNPFEYWITHPNPKYKELMHAVERFIIEPGDDDVRVDEVFTDRMFQRLLERMTENGLSELETVKSMWESTYRSRRVVSEFLRDGEIGKKRLASMPDRVTNTIRTASDSIFRPTVINCYQNKFSSVDDWFEQWISFFFELSVDLGGKEDEKGKHVYMLLQQIKQKKYPAVTAEEEAASIPLQLVLQGIFDAILVNLMQLKGGDIWEDLRREICASLNSRKNDRIVEILSTSYQNADVIFLQEAGNQLLSELGKFKDFSVIAPSNYARTRSQNSLIMLRKTLFTDPSEVVIPADGWDAGDLLIVASRLNGTEITLASFHGDTNGLLTVPCVQQVAKHLPTKTLLFGLDANTYERLSKSTAHVLDFEQAYLGLGFQAIWGKVKPSQYTTFNARTYLQPQLNKAAKSTELAEKGDRNPKDFILFTKDHFSAVEVWRDNTGKGEYVEDMVFPTLEFPSDHAVIAADLVFSIDAGRRTEL